MTGYGGGGSVGLVVQALKASCSRAVSGLLSLYSLALQRLHREHLHTV